MIEGTCDNRFRKVKNIFSHALKSGFETGAALAIEYNGETIDNNGGDTTGKGYYASVWDW